MSDINSTPVPVGVVGCGRMGGFHARVYGRLPQAKLVGVYDQNAEAAQKTAEACQTRAFDSLDALLQQVRAVTIAVPTTHHAETARPFLDRGIACLIEKPLAPDSRQGRQIADWAAQGKALVQVGHIERFNPAIRAADALDLHPKFIEAVRISPLTFRSLDVGVVLDMMIHDLDLILKFAGGKVERVDVAGARLVGDSEDVCNARLSFDNGCVANVTASRLAMKTERRLRLFCPDRYVSIDFQKRQGVVAARRENIQSIREAASQSHTQPSPDFTQLVHLHPLAVDATDPLEAQLTAFLAAVKNGTPSPVPVEAGLAAVELAEQIRAKIAN